MTRKRTAEITRPIPLYKETLVHSPGGASARGPCGPNAIHQAAIQYVSVKYRQSEAFGAVSGDEKCKRRNPSCIGDSSSRCACYRDIPAFFSCSVNSCQSTFILSLSCIHSSACSCGGMPSHLFSMPANVGLDIAWADRLCCVDGVWVGC
jgi:hypothetical protein